MSIFNPRPLRIALEPEDIYIIATGQGFAEALDLILGNMMREGLITQNKAMMCSTVTQ